MGRSLTLAATAIACGFLAFAPTDYYGVSQLGVIAGVGMFIALILNLTLLPALIRIGGAPGGVDRGVDARLGLIDSEKSHRKLVVGTGVGGLVSGGPDAAAALRLQSDPPAQRQDRVGLDPVRPDAAIPDQTPNTAWRPCGPAWPSPTGSPPSFGPCLRFRTCAPCPASLIPADQAAKLAAIKDDGNTLLAFTFLNPIAVAPPPSDAEVVPRP